MVWVMRRTIFITLLGAALAGVAAVETALAAPGNSPGAAPLVGAAGAKLAFDTRSYSAATTDPAASCTGGQPVRGSAWLRLRPRRSTLVRLSAVGRAQTSVAALYAVRPLAGTELICFARPAASTAAATEHVLAAGVTYFLMLGTMTEDDVLDVGIQLQPTRWLAAPPLAARRQGPGVVSDGASLYSFGGYQSSFTNPGQPTAFHSVAINRFDLRRGRWSTVGAMPTGLSYAEPVYLSGRVFIPGGRTDPVRGANCMVSTHHAFNPATRRWSTKRSYDGAPIFDYTTAADPRRGIYYMVGGAWDPTPCDFGSQFADVQPLNVVRAYDVRRDVWTDLPPMPTRRQGARAEVVNGFLIVAGGLDGRTASSALEIYDPRTGTWYTGAPLPLATWEPGSGIGITRNGRPTLVLAGGWTHAFGGIDHGVTQIYDIGSGRWSYDSARLTPREGMGAAVLGGRLFTVGGFQGEAVRAVEHLAIDRKPPTLSFRRTSTGGVRIRASDSSGIAAVRWRLGTRWRSGTVIPPGAAASSLIVRARDRAGNTATSRVR